MAAILSAILVPLKILKADNFSKSIFILNFWSSRQMSRLMTKPTK